MFCLNILVLLLYLMLALLSRKHFSKYKRRGFLGYLQGIGMAMSEQLLILLKIKEKKELSEKIRRLNVTAPKDTASIAKNFLVCSTCYALVIFFVFNLLSLGLGIKEKQGDLPDAREVVREGYGGRNEEYTFNLFLGDKLYEYTMQVAPLEYTEEEFVLAGNKVLDDLSQSVLGDNPDLLHVSTNLDLQLSDPKDLFIIEWSSDNTTLIDNDGYVFQKNISTGDKVVLTATLYYKDFSLKRDYIVQLVKDDSDVTKIEETKQILSDIEAKDRTNTHVEIPEKIGNVKIEMHKEKANTNVKVAIMGVIVVVAVLVVRKEQLKRDVEKRDNMLIKMYPSFVNKLWLLLGAGMTVKNALRCIIAEGSDRNIFVRELEYGLNEIGSGIDEAEVYERLGGRLGIPIYTKFMNQLSHNIRRGNSDLLRIMEDEVALAQMIRKEQAKKLGEKASTKLVFPMVVLLVVVMVIVMAPALADF